MFILTNVNPQMDSVTIFDTKDNTQEVVSLFTVSQQINNKKLKVYGLRPLANATRNCISLQNYNIAVSQDDAKTAMAGYYSKVHGISKQEARAMLG